MLMRTIVSGKKQFQLLDVRAPFPSHLILPPPSCLPASLSIGRRNLCGSPSASYPHLWAPCLRGYSSPHGAAAEPPALVAAMCLQTQYKHDIEGLKRELRAEKQKAAESKRSLQV